MPVTESKSPTVSQSISTPNSPSLFILIDGLKLLTKPGIRGYVIIPLLVNILICAGLFIWGFSYIESYQLQIESWLPDWLDFLGWALWPIYIVIALLLMAYGFTTITNIIAAPFNALLSEKVEQTLGLPSNEAASGVKGFIASIPRAIKREIYKFIKNLKWMLLLLILLLIPGVNLISLLIGSWLMAIQYLDYPADNHQMSYSDFLNSIRKKRLSALLFGLSVMLVSMIPFANLLVVPAAICSGTALWHRDFTKQ